MPPVEQLLDLDVLSARALRPHASAPRPFLKWAGSKRNLLHHIVPVLPTRFRTYREPFLGSAALFFLLRPDAAVLSDRASELIQTFIAVRDNVAAVERYLRQLDPSRSTYYAVRSNRSRGRFKRAAEFIYLNRNCWNGLFRVNSAGQFNVPYGWPKGPNEVDIPNLRACATLLRGPRISIWSADFEENLDDAKAGDLVYLDPPYVTGHNNNGFVDYNEVLFSWADQIRLAVAADRLAARGATVIVSNANHNEVIKLYPDFTRISFSRSSTLASDKTKRGAVSEVLMVSPRRGK